MAADSAPRTADRNLPRERSARLLFAALEEAARRLTFSALLYRLLYLIAAVILFPLLVVVGDHLIPGGLPRLVIFGAGILWGVATILTVMGVSLRTVLRRLNKVFVARHLERSRGIRHNPLINMVLLGRSPEAGYVRDGAVQQAASVLERSGPEAPGSAVPLRQPGLLLLVAVVLWLLYTAITPKPILPSLARLFGADRAAPTATRLELVRPRPDEPVYVGEPLELVFAVSGHSVAEVWFELRDPAAYDAPPLLSSALRRSTDADAENLYRIGLAAHEVSGDLHYRCSAGDAALEGVITVQPRPDLLEWQIELAPPAYVQEPAQQTTEPELRVWAGTRATFGALANTEVRDPIFVFRGETETRTRMSVDPARPHRAVLSLPLTSSGEYWLEFSDRWGRPCCDPPTHRIFARRDAAPQVEITAPSREETPRGVVDITHTPWLRAVASDDVRLEALFLVHDRAGTVGRTNLLDSEAPVRGRRIEVGIATSNLSLEVGESLLVWLEARDNRVLLDGTPAPQVAASRELTLIRLPDVLPEQVGDEAVADLTDLADATGAKKQAVKRPRTRDGGEGEPADSASETGQAAASRDGTDSSSGRYRRASDGGIGDEAADDQEPPGALRPEDIIEVEGEDGAAQESADDDGAAGGQSAAANHFKEELRQFGQQHGDEAREVNKCFGSRPDDTASEDSPSGQGAAGPRAEDSPLEKQDDSRSDSEDSPDSNEAGVLQPDELGELRQRQPESQPSERSEPEPNQPEATDDEPTERSDGAQPPSEEQDRAQDKQRPETPSEKPEQSQPQPASDEEGGQEGGTPQKKDEQAKSEQAEAAPESEKAAGRDEAAEPKEGPKPEQQPPLEPDDEQAQQAQHDEAAQQAPADDRPDAGSAERVIPMPAKDRAPQLEPPPGRPTSGAGAHEEPGDSGPRSELTDTLELLRRGEEIAEEDLLELGWPPEKTSAFIRDFERLQEAARRAGIMSQLKWWRANLAPGSGEVTRGGRLSQEIFVSVTGEPSVRDGLEQIAPPAEQRIAPELRALLEAYYRSLAERRTQPPGSEPPPAR